MFMPTIFHENLFDDFFDPFWNDGALERAMNREERETFGKRGANMMKTDVKQTADGSYDVAVDLPGCKKEDVQMELNDGYLTIQAVRSHSNDEKDKEGRYLRRETFSGTCARSFYVGDAVKKEDTAPAISWMRGDWAATWSRMSQKSCYSRATIRSWAERMVCSISLSSWVMYRSQLVRVCLRMYPWGTWS